MAKRLQINLDEDQQKKFPEHAKLQALQDENRMMGDWLTYGRGFQMGPKALSSLLVTLSILSGYKEHDENGVEETMVDKLVKFVGWWAKNRMDPYMRYDRRPEHVLAKYYGIDLQKLDDEKRQMIKMLQEANS